MTHILASLSLTILIFGCKSRTTSDTNLKLIDAQDSNSAFVGMIKYDNGYICSGSFIPPNFVLTAAHCVIDTSRLNEQADKCAGPKNAFFTGQMSRGSFYLNGQVADINYGWSFGSNLGDSDVGLLRLSSNLTNPLHDGQVPYRIELHPSPNSGTSQYAVGFGCTYTKYKSDCGGYYEGTYETTGRRRSVNVKSGFYEGCPGDSGGPVFNFYYTDESNTQITAGIFGIISFFDNHLSDDERRSRNSGSYYAKPKQFENRIIDIMNTYR